MVHEDDGPDHARRWEFVMRVTNGEYLSFQKKRTPSRLSQIVSECVNVAQNVTQEPIDEHELCVGDDRDWHHTTPLL